MNKPYKLVYISNANNDLLATELYDIIKISTINNRKLGISGMLFFKSGMFMQVLEGDKDTIVNLYYNHIVHDNRHHDCKVVIEGYDNRKTFERWDMHFNAFDRYPYFEKEDLENDTDLGIYNFLDKFDKNNM